MAETGPHAAALSAEELKSQLYHKFQKKGILDDMRAQLRNRLVTELNTGTMVTSASRQPKTPLIVQVTNWLIAEHLRRYDYSYTLSVFVSESRTLTNTEDMFSLEDILQLLRIDPKSKLYQALMERAEQEELGSILCHILRLLDVDLSLQDQCIQTENKIQMSVTYTFQEKLQQVEDLYYLKKGARRIEAEDTVEGHLLKYQQHIEEKARKEAKEELDTFKNRELLSMKHKEQEKCRREFELRRKEVEKEYREKVESLSKREQKNMKDVEKLREKLEYDTFRQRQEILSQLDTVRQKELEARRLAEMYRSESNVDKERLKAQKEKLKIREQALRERESALDRLISERSAKARLEEQQQHLDKMTELQQQELTLVTLKKELETQKETYNLKQLEANDAIQKTKDLESRVGQLQASETFIKQQNQRLNEEIRELEECRGAKSEASMLRQEVSTLQRSVQNVITDREHLSRLVQELKEQLAQPSPQVVALKRELEQEQDGRRLDKAIAQDQRSRFETELTTALDRNKALSLRLEQQMLVAQQLQTTNRDLRDQLQSAYAFTGGPHRSENRMPTPSLVKQRSQPNLFLLNDENPSAFFDTSLNASQIPPELELQGRMTEDFELPESLVPKTDFYVPVSRPRDFTFLQQSQSRFRALEREAELLEQQYRDFHQRRLSKPMPRSRLDQDLSPSFLEDLKLPAYQSDGGDQLHSAVALKNRSHWVSVPTPSDQQTDRLFSSHASTANIKQNYRIVADTDTFNWSYSNMPKTVRSTPVINESEINKVSKTQYDGKHKEDNPLHSTLLNDETNGSDSASRDGVGDEKTFEFRTHFIVPPTSESDNPRTNVTAQKKLSFDDNPSYIDSYANAAISDTKSSPIQTQSVTNSVINMSVSKSLQKLDLDSAWKGQTSLQASRSPEISATVHKLNVDTATAEPGSKLKHETETKISYEKTQSASVIDSAQAASFAPKVDSESAWKAQSESKEPTPPNLNPIGDKLPIVSTVEKTPSNDQPALASINLDSQWGEIAHHGPQTPILPSAETKSSPVVQEWKGTSFRTQTPTPPSDIIERKQSVADSADPERIGDDDKSISVASDNVADDFFW